MASDFLVIPDGEVTAKCALILLTPACGKPVGFVSPNSYTFVLWLLG